MTLLEPHPIVFQSTFGTITAHGVFFALGAVVAAWFFAYQIRQAGMGRFVQGFESAVLIFVLGLFGARFGYLITYRAEWTSFGQLFAVWQGGLVSFWGIAAGFAAAWWLARHWSGEKRVTWWRTMVLAGLLGWGIGRLGNYYMSDSFGVLSSHWSAFYGRVPIQLLESLWCLLLFFTLRRRADAAWLGVLGYIAGRFIIDTWRDELQLGPLHLSQWFAILALVILISVYVHRRAR